jgi:hypothetical protein
MERHCQRQLESPPTTDTLSGAMADEVADLLLAIAPWPGSAGLPVLRPTWRPRSGLTSWLHRTN